MADEKWFQIFEAGNYSHVGKGNWPVERLKKVVANYRPGDNGIAPIQINHRAAGPAGGIVESLKLVGKSLYAKPAQLAAEFVRDVRAGSFSGVSVSLSRSKNSLAHVAFLPGGEPEVAGLTPALFEKDNDIACFELDTVEFSNIENQKKGGPMDPELKELLEGLKVRLDKMEGSQVAVATKMAEFEKTLDEPEAVPEVKPAPAVKPTADEVEFEDLKKQSAVTVAELTKLRAEIDERDTVEFCKELKDKGILLPALSGDVAAFHAALPVTSDVVNFSDGPATSLRDAFKNLLSRFPKIVDYDEVSRGSAASGDAVEFEKTQKSEYYDVNKETFEKTGVSKDAFLKHGEIPD